MLGLSSALGSETSLCSLPSGKLKKVMGKAATVIESERCLCLVFFAFVVSVVNIGNHCSSPTCKEFLPAGPS